MLGLKKLAKQVFGTPNERRIKAMRPIVDSINALESNFEALSDQGLIEKTNTLIIIEIINGIIRSRANI